MAFRFPSVIDLQRQNRTDTQRLFNQLGANAIANEAAAIKQQQLGQQLLLNAKQQQLDALKFDQTMEMRQKELDARIKAQESQERIARARISASQAYKAPSEERLRFKAELDFHEGVETNLIKELAGFDEATTKGEDLVTTMEERDAFLAQRKAKRAELEAQLQEVRRAKRETFEGFEGEDTRDLPKALPVPSESTGGVDPELSSDIPETNPFLADRGLPTENTENPQKPQETLFPDRGVPGPTGQPGAPKPKTYSSSELLMVGQKDNILGENARELFRQSLEFKGYMEQIEGIQDKASERGIKEVTDRTAEMIQKLYNVKDYSTPAMIRADIAGLKAMFNSAMEFKELKVAKERQDDQDSAKQALLTSMSTLAKEFGEDDDIRLVMQARVNEAKRAFLEAGGKEEDLPMAEMLQVGIENLGSDPDRMSQYSRLLSTAFGRLSGTINQTSSEVQAKRENEVKETLNQDVQSFIESLRATE